MLPAISAAIDPTDRSMPPEMMTKHMPMEMIPMKAVRVSTFIRLPQVAKSGFSAVPITSSSTSPTTGPKRCGSKRRFALRGAARSPRPSVAGVGADVGPAGICPDGMGNQLLFAEPVGGHGRGHPTPAHHDHPVAEPDQFDQFR